MFKCKQCGRQFGANVPKVCPGCGATEQAEREERGAYRLGWLSLLDPLGEGCFLIIAIGLLVCFVGTLNRLFGWFW